MERRDDLEYYWVMREWAGKIYVKGPYTWIHDANLRARRDYEHPQTDRREHIYVVQARRRSLDRDSAEYNMPAEKYKWKANDIGVSVYDSQMPGGVYRTDENKAVIHKLAKGDRRLELRLLYGEESDPRIRERELEKLYKKPPHFARGRSLPTQSQLSRGL